jgi:hypothetical protein
MHTTVSNPGLAAILRAAKAAGARLWRAAVTRVGRLRAQLRVAVAALPVIAAVAGLWATPVPAGAATRVGPDQHFIGLVNGTDTNAVVYTVCPGPVVPGRTGPVEGGQTLSVERQVGGSGYTGPFDSIHAWFVPATGTHLNAPPSVTFARYGVAKVIPPTVRVPCDGTGTVEFSSCPYLAPCAYGWVPDFVTVTFINIAV